MAALPLFLISTALLQCRNHHGKDTYHNRLYYRIHPPSPFLPIIITKTPITPSGAHPDLIRCGIVIVAVVGQPFFFLDDLLVYLQHHTA